LFSLLPRPHAWTARVAVMGAWSFFRLRNVYGLPSSSTGSISQLCRQFLFFFAPWFFFFFFIGELLLSIISFLKPSLWPLSIPSHKRNFLFFKVFPEAYPASLFGVHQGPSDHFLFFSNPSLGNLRLSLPFPDIFNSHPIFRPKLPLLVLLTE